MHNPTPLPAASPFDAIRQTRPDGSEFWSARTLMPLLGYRKWERFADTVEQARAVIEAEDGPDAADREASRCREAFGRTRQAGDNFHLSRRASYGLGHAVVWGVGWARGWENAPFVTDAQYLALA